MTGPVAFLAGRVVLHPGDCREVLAGLADSSIDSVVTDPPYALVSIGKRFGKPGASPTKDGDVYSRASAGFMGQQWDTGETAFAAEFWAQVLRVLKPGGHIVAFSGTRTYHRMVCAIEDAGFEIRDQLAWVYGSGFPKSHDVSKAIDKLDAAAERRRRALAFTAWVRSVGLSARAINEATGTVMGSHYVTDKEQPLVATREHLEVMRPLIQADIPDWVEQLVDQREVESANFKARPVTGQHDAPAQASKWRAEYEGGEVAPAGVITEAFTAEAAQWSGWGTALKPAWEPIVLARKPFKGSVAESVLLHGTGALNVDACRVGSDVRYAAFTSLAPCHGNALGAADTAAARRGTQGEPKRYEGRWPANIVHDGSDQVLAAFPDAAGQQGVVTGNEPSSPFANVYGDMPSRAGRAEPRGDSGSAARFFYSAKADADDRLVSKHPTVKPVDLMQWLCRLVTPPGGRVLDPFAGTGTTGEAAFREGFGAVLIEREPQFQTDIARRMDLVLAGPASRKAASAKARAKDDDAGPLFATGEKAA